MKKLKLLAAAAIMAATLPAFSAPEFKVVGLGFEGMQVQQFVGTALIFTPAQVWQFYNGGYSRSEDGKTDLVRGPDYGVPFSSSALALMSTASGGDGNFGPRFLDSLKDPLPDAGISALFFTEDSPVLNFSQGFNTGFSFYYASDAPIQVTLYDGLDATGAVLASNLNILATETCPDDDNTYCIWSIGSVAFKGTARSAKLGGLGGQALFDNVTFGALTPIDGALPVPEPGSFALVAAGLVGIGWAARRRRLPA